MLGTVLDNGKDLRADVTEPRFLTRKLAQEAGWFSRRHRTSEAHREAVKTWREHHGRKARQRRAQERLAV